MTLLDSSDTLSVPCISGEEISSEGNDTTPLPSTGNLTPDRGLQRRKCPPVAMRGRMTPNGYEPENMDWVEVLAPKVDEYHRHGVNPMEIDPEVLTLAGHPPRRTRDLVRAMGDVPLADGLVRHSDLRKHCLGCAENEAEVRRCQIINCPFWPYRMGKNPHNPRRGTNPFALREAA